MYVCTLATNIPMYRHTYVYIHLHVRTCKYLHTCDTYVVYTYTYQAIIFLISFLTFIHYFFYFLFDTLQLLIQLTALVLQNTSSEQHQNVIIIRALIVKLSLSLGNIPLITIQTPDIHVFYHPS